MLSLAYPNPTIIGRLRPCFVAASLLLGGVSGCHRQAPAPAKGAVASSSASAVASAEPPRARCLGVDTPGLRASLGAPAPPPAASAEEGDDGIGLPFSPELGGATALDDGFLVGVLEPSKDGTSAAILHLSASQTASKRIDLGKIHGDVLAPRVIARPEGVVAVVPDGAPNGSILRFAKIDDVNGEARVTWGADLPQGNDESDAFAVEPGDKAFAVAWDEWDSRDAHSVVRTAVFASMDVSKAPPSAVVSGAHEDAEAPTLARRPGGFWAAWITNVKREPDKKERGEANESAEPVDMGPRWVSVAPLDPLGKPSGSAVVVTPKAGHVQGFDLAANGDGSALVVWREDTTSPATPGGAVRVALVRADGSVDAHALDDDDVGAGVPALLLDEAPPVGAPSTWLSLASEADSARFGALGNDGRALDGIDSDPNLGVATPLAVRGGRFLVARPRGRGVELEVLACRKREPASPAPDKP